MIVELDFSLLGQAGDAPPLVTSVNGEPIHGLKVSFGRVGNLAITGAGRFSYMPHHDSQGELDVFYLTTSENVKMCLRFENDDHKLYLLGERGWDLA